MHRKKIYTQAEDGALLAIDVATDVPASKQEALNGLKDFLPPFGWAPASRPFSKATTFEVRLGNLQSMSRFESDYGLAVAEHLAGRVALHAACFVFEGRVILLPARSGAGKSTLARYALSQGCEVLSDEYCVVNNTTLEVIPWPRPIRTASAGGGTHRTPVHPSSNGLVPTHVFDLRFSEQVFDLLTSPMTAAETALALISNAVPAALRPTETFGVATRLATQVSGYAGRRGGASFAFGKLAELCNGA